jgi:CRISPR-associated exonuclease Cas4
MYAEDDLLPLSAVADFVFCTRRAALHRLEQVWQENIATAEGHVLHDRADSGVGDSRGDLRIARSLLLRSLRLGLTGKTDIVEFHRLPDGADGVKLPRTAGVWRPYPVEYKRGILRHEEAYAVQLCAQAICLEEMLQTTVPAGALFYGLSKRRLDVTFTESLRRATDEAAAGLHALIAAGKTPPPNYEKKCTKCSLFDLCLPMTTGGKRSAVRYLAEILA